MKNLDCPACGSHIDLRRFLRPRFILCACGARLTLRPGIIAGVALLAFLIGVTSGVVLTMLRFEVHLSMIGMATAVATFTGAALLGLHTAARCVDAPFTTMNR